jgi:hypothetical protein
MDAEHLRDVIDRARLVTLALLVEGVAFPRSLNEPLAPFRQPDAASVRNAPGGHRACEIITSVAGRLDRSLPASLDLTLARAIIDDAEGARRAVAPCALLARATGLVARVDPLQAGLESRLSIP